MIDLNKPHEPRCTECEKVICGEGIYWKNTKDFFHPDCDLLYRTTHPKLWRYLEQDELYPLWKMHGKPEKHYRRTLTCSCKKVFHDISVFNPHAVTCKEFLDEMAKAGSVKIEEQPSQPCSYSEPPPKPRCSRCNSSEKLEEAGDSVRCYNCNSWWWKSSPERTLTFKVYTETPSPLDKPESVCAEADRIINGERRSAYGPVEESFVALAEAYSVVLRKKLKEPLTAHDAALLGVALKLVRESNAPKRDNRVDLCGYASLADKVAPK